MNYLSLCSGIEAATATWHSLGWTAVALAEIEPFPSAVLAAHYPDVPNLGDMTQYLTWPVELLAEVDILVGGTPCQAFSVAGARESLGDERGNLTLTYAHILDAIDRARALHGRPPALCLWENVPGVLNTDDNALGCFLGLLAGEDDALTPPGGRWSDAGYVRGPSRAIAWRCLDAQYFGLAQRRDRIFLIASAGDIRPEEILFESQGLRRDTPPSRGQGERTSGTLGSSFAKRGYDDRGDTGGAPLIPEIAHTLQTTCNDYSRADGFNMIPVRDSGLPPWQPCECCDDFWCNIHECHTGECDCPEIDDWGDIDPYSPIIASSPTEICMATGQASAEIGIGIGTTLNCNHEAPIVAFSGRERGDDGRGYDRSPQVFGDAVGALDTVKPHCVAYDTTQITSATNRCNPAPGDPCHPLAAAAHPPLLIEQGQVEEGTLFFADDDFKTGSFEECDTARPLTTSADRTRSAPIALAFETRFARNGRGAPDEICSPLKAESGSNGTGDGAPCVVTPMAVRRLTPRECERLQGFPDDYTAITYRNKPAADGPRYKALGNSMAVPVMRWLGKRIAMFS
jgi:DNA (cytosine-5)-methyltransferase 1